MVCGLVFFHFEFFKRSTITSLLKILQWSPVSYLNENLILPWPTRLCYIGLLPTSELLRSLCCVPNVLSIFIILNMFFCLQSPSLSVSFSKYVSPLCSLSHHLSLSLKVTSSYCQLSLKSLFSTSIPFCVF